VDLPSALYWDEAENAAAHTIDIMPKAKLGMSMYEHRTGRKPDYSREYPFGAIAAVRMTGNVKRGDNPGVKALHLGPAANGDAGRRFLRLATGTVITSNSFWIDSDCFSWTHAAAQDGVRALKEMGRELPREEDRMATGLRQQREQHIPVPDAMEGKAHEQQQVQAPVEAKAYEQQQDPVEVAPEEEPAEEPAGRPARARQAREPRFDPTLLDLAFKQEEARRRATAQVARATEPMVVVNADFRQRRRRRRAEKKAIKRSKAELKRVTANVNTAELKRVTANVNTATWWEQNAEQGAVPATLEEAQADTEMWPYYKAALEIEVANQQEADTHVKEPIRPGQARLFPKAQVIGVKYVFDKKQQDTSKPADSFVGPQYYKQKMPDGTIRVWLMKARWVARGDHQQEGTFGVPYAPTPVFATLLMIIAMCVGLGWDIHTLDVKHAFLLPRLRKDETIYLEPPKGDADRGLYLYRLLACIYGLRQSGAEWRKNVCAKLVSLGFTPMKADPCVYVRYDEAGELVCAIGVHVDDFMVGTDDATMTVVKNNLLKAYKMRDDGRVSWFLKIKFTWSENRKTVYLTQPEYIEQIMEAAGVTALDTDELVPARPGEVLMRMEEECELAEQDMPDVPFQKVLGMVSYVSAVLRPDITYSVAAIQRCASAPRLRHWEALTHVVRYLAGTKDFGIRFSADPEEDVGLSRGKVVALSDADHGKDPQTRRSISGGGVMMNGGPLMWRSVQNKHVTRSTMESELSALDLITKDALFARKIGMELKVAGAERIDIYEDNEACERFANGSKLSPLTKHIDIKLFAVRDDVEQGRVRVLGISTDKNTADIFTKPLGAPEFQKHRRGLGIVNVPASLLRK
jgi:hypothetical protein